MAAKSARSGATEEDLLRRDEALMRKLGIHHQPQNTPDTWPLHLRNTFKSLETLGSIKYHSYDENAPTQHGTVAWRADIKLRAKQLSDTAQRLLKESPSELTWRFELEKLVDARFNMKTECPICSDTGRSSRLWRSEIEVTTECNGPITTDLESRRKTRVPCQCGDVAYTGLNPLFSNRADQAFHYEPHLTPSRDIKNLTRRRADRVYGLRQTTNFEERLNKPAKSVLEDTNETSIAAVRDLIDSEAEEVLVREYIQATPFHRRGEPLLFPFLVMEAKSEEGGGFSRCGIQTSLPIWSLLRSQEMLSELGTPLSELGGPLIWYIAYLGDDWRVSGCCTTVERGHKTYQIIDLWHGRICSPDGALQVLLIIDYIFDWARDLYRPSILRSLEAIATQAYDDLASIAADSDILSSRKNPRAEDMTEVESNPDMEDLETSANDESLLDPWKKFDLEALRGVCGYDLRVFRPSSIIKSVFQCLNITGDNIGTLIASLGGNPQNHTKMAREALAALRSGPMVATERILSQIEDMWTGTPRANRHAGAGQEKYCSIAYAATISDSWELTRAIMCFAVDKSALDTIRRHAGLQRKTFRLDGMEDTAQILDESTAAAIVQFLKNRDGEETLSFALSRTSEIWKPATLLRRQERRKLRAADEGGISLKPVPNSARSNQKIVHETYRRHRQPGLLEPDNFPYLRFSAQLDSLETHVPIDHSPVISLKADRALPSIPPNSAILVCNQYRSELQLCVYMTGVHQGPPQLSDVFDALATATTTQQFFILARSHYDPEAAKREICATVDPGEELLSSRIAAASRRWIIKLCHRFGPVDLAQIGNQSSRDALAHAFAKFNNNSRDVHEEYFLRRKRPFYITAKNRDTGSDSDSDSDSPPAKKPRRVVVDLEGSPFTNLPSPPLDNELDIPPEYSKAKEIEAILDRADGDGLTDDQINVLMELGYFDGLFTQTRGP